MGFFTPYRPQDFGGNQVIGYTVCQACVDELEPIELAEQAENAFLRELHERN